MKRPTFLLSILTALVAVAPAHAQARPNRFGVTVVRFAHGTTPAQMRSAVAAAGGDVITDLSRIDAMAVAPVAADFAPRIRGNGRVVATFVDPVLTAPDGVDASAADTSSPAPPLGDAGGSFPDPWHDAFQWDDARMNVPGAWALTLGDRGVRVAVVDSGVQGSHKELLPNYDNQASETLIPCNTLVRDFGAATVNAYGLRDCSSEDTDGHGTWTASRIAGAANGFASNGVAPRVQIVSYKVIATGFGGLSSWIVAGMLDACAQHVDLVNLSIGGYLDASDPADVQDYLLFADAVSYCRSQGVAVFSAAGNDHVRIDRVDLTLGGRSLAGAGRVSTGPEGIGSTSPGSASPLDLRGLLEVPAGVPGVTMVSATNNAIAAAPASVPLRWTAHVGARNQLAYYSNYGPRVDLAAPGGARSYNIPRYDGGAGDVLYGGWGSFGALDPSGALCTDPAFASFACFKVTGAGFGWLQGTSMAAPNAVGVAALALSAHPELRANPDALAASLRSGARRDLTNYTGPNDPSNFVASLSGVPCDTGYCHIDQQHPISFSDAYGAGLVNAAVVAP